MPPAPVMRRRSATRDDSSSVPASLIATTMLEGPAGLETVALRQRTVLSSTPESFSGTSPIRWIRARVSGGNSASSSGPYRERVNCVPDSSAVPTSNSSAEGYCWAR